MPDLPSFEHCRREAHRLLGDAADWIRMGDWPDVTDEQRAAILEALLYMSSAKGALNKAANRG